MNIQKKLRKRQLIIIGIVITIFAICITACDSDASMENAKNDQTTTAGTLETTTANEDTTEDIETEAAETTVLDETTIANEDITEDIGSELVETTTLEEVEDLFPYYDDFMIKLSQKKPQFSDGVGMIAFQPTLNDANTIVVQFVPCSGNDVYSRFITIEEYNKLLTIFGDHAKPLILVNSDGHAEQRGHVVSAEEVWSLDLIALLDEAFKEVLYKLCP